MVKNQKEIKDNQNQVHETQKPLLVVENLNMAFKVRGLYFNALKNISFSVNQGDFFGIIGESGSGKSTTGKCIIKLYQPTGGKIEIDNHLISNKRLSYKTNKWLRKNVQMIFQDPMASLNPTKNILQLISEPLVINKTIYKNAVKQWKKINNVAKYYLLDYKKTNEELVYNFQKDYLTTFNEKAKKFLAKFEDDISANDSYKNSREKLIFKMDTVVEYAQENSGKITSFINESQKAINTLVERYNVQDYNDVFKNYEESLIEKNQFHDLYKYSQEGCEYREKIEAKDNELKDLVSNFKETYVIQNYGYIKSWETTIRSNIRSLKQNMNFSKDTIDYTIHFVNLTIQKFLLIFVKTLKKHKYLEESQINSTVTYSQELVEKVFKPLNEKIMKLSMYFNNASVSDKNIAIENLLALRMFAVCLYKNFKEKTWKNFEHCKKQYEDIYTKCPNFNVLDEQLECSVFLNQNFEEDFKELNKTYDELDTLIKRLSIKSMERLKKHKEDSSALRKELKALKIDFVVCKSVYKENKKELNSNKEKYLNSEIKFNLSKQERQKYLKEVVLAPLSGEEVSKIVQEKLDIKNLKVENKNLMKQLRNKSKKIIKKIKEDFAKENSKEPFFKRLINQNNYIKVVKREVNLRKKSIDALGFEFRNSMKEYKINKFIFEQSRYINWLLIPALIDLDKKDLVYKALDSVGLKREHAYRYPHEFSGGQRQRIVIARALINKPKIIIADEPISALDVSIQAQIINILQDLCKKQNVTILFIAHDLSMVNYACNNVIIMHRGRILEKGNVDKIFNNPIHPYTRSLMKATPKLSRVHVDLAAFNEDFTYDKDWSAFNKPDFVKINNDDEHQVFGVQSQVNNWITNAKKEKDVE